MKRSVRCAVVLGGCWLVSCGPPGAVGSSVRPEAPSGAEAVDGAQTKCRAVGPTGQPLIVDWPAHQRADLEVAMMQGVAIVGYSCERLELLTDCQVDGQYGFLGVEPHADVVQLLDADEVRANLPGFSGALIADVGAELQRGSSIDLAMIIAGKAMTTVPHTSRDKLVGRCDGATHFVRGAFVGAFAMAKGTRGTARTAAQIFGAGVDAQSTSSRRATSKDGEPAACSSVEPGDSKPPAKCRSAIRLELVALTEEGVEPPTSSTIDDVRAANACPEGMVQSGGKCTTPTQGSAYQCSGSDPTECQAQCDRGSVTSCFILGVMSESGQGVRQDYQHAARLYDQTCSKGLAEGCNRLGVLHFYGSGVSKDGPRAAELFLGSCRLGSADACSNLGLVLDVGRGVVRDSARAAQLFEAACNGGDSPGCFNAGVLHSAGRGTKRDEARAAAFFNRARQGGILDRLRLGCSYGNAYSCFGLGYLHQRGLWLPQDDAAAKSYFERSCPGVEWGCEALGRPGGG